MKILYFAWVREKTGIASEEISLPDGIGTATQLMDWLSVRGDGFADAFANTDTVRVAINQEHASLDHPVTDSDEVAFFPPVTGG